MPSASGRSGGRGHCLSISVLCVGFRIQDLGFRVQGFSARVLGFGVRVQTKVLNPKPLEAKVSESSLQKRKEGMAMSRSL